MAKHRAVIIGAGRIGAGYQWGDLEYTHAGAYQALRDRVELVGFIEPDNERAVSAKLRWHVPVYEDLASLAILEPDIVSVCTQPEHQEKCIEAARRHRVKGIWCEKPWVTMPWYSDAVVQVNYLRRGDRYHRHIAGLDPERGRRLVVYAKDDIHTRCHFEDLSKWWSVPLVYRTFNGPCAYILDGDLPKFFDNGGINPGECMKAMLGNLLDHIDNGTPLWSPPYSDEKEVHIEL